MRKKAGFIFLALSMICFSGRTDKLSMTAEVVQSSFVQSEMTVYEGIYLEVKGKPVDNYRKVGIVLDNPVAIGTNDFLSLRFRNLAEVNIPLSITLQDEDGNLLYTGYTGSESKYKTHYYIPEDSGELQTVKEYYACLNMKKDIRGGELLVDLSEMVNTGSTFTDIEKIFVGLPAAYNIGEKIELLNIQLVNSVEFSFTEGEGFSISENEIIESFERTELYDFTAIESQTQFEELCKEYKILKCNKDNAVTKTFEDYVSIGKSELARGVTLKEKCENGIKFALKENGTYLSGNESDITYAKDKFGYIRLADLSEKPVEIGDALALKMCALYNNSAFRIIVVETDGEAWQGGAASGQFVFADENGNIEYMPTYYNCIWPGKKEGTLTIPYASMKYLSPGSVALNNKENDKVLTDIKEVYLAMDMASSSNAAKFRKIAFAEISNVDFTQKSISTLADLTKYSISEIKERKADTNFAVAEKSTLTKPCSTNKVSNANWVLGRATLRELASKELITTTHLGDVKILDNFRIADKGYEKEEKDEIIGSFYSTYGETSYLAYGALGDNTPALEWKIGNYVNEYQNVSGGYCGLTIDPVAEVDDWENWVGAKGITLRIKNPQSKEISFNIAFQQKTEDQTIAYRMNHSNAIIYALDVLTGEEFSFRTGSVSSFSSGPAIYLPANFDGWIRIDFSAFGKYSVTGPDEIDFTNKVIALKITSYMFDNSEARILFGTVGVYYDTFTVGWNWDNSGRSIADCLRGESDE
mgnify:CR=1 FL=1